MGVYELPSRERLFLAPMVDESGATLQFAFERSGLEGRARVMTDRSYCDAEQCPNRFRFSAEGVDWTNHGKTQRALRLMTMREEPIAFKASDGVTIGGSVWTSSKHRSATAVVLAHGADDETRMMGIIIPLLVNAGVTVFTLDQRGSGESGGAWRTDGILRIAEDMVQAAKNLQQSFGVQRVGFYGFSNGGWIAPAAAARFEQPAFLVIKSGASQSIESNVRWEQTTAIARQFDAASAERAGQILDLTFAALHSDTPQAWNMAKSAIAEAELNPWFKKMPLPPSAALPLSESMKAGFRRQLFYDPSEDLKQLRCPVLVLLGAQDLEVDSPESAAGYQSLLTGVSSLEVHVFPMAGHQLAMKPGPSAENSMETGKYAPGYMRDLARWIRKQAGTSVNRPEPSR